MEDAVGEVQLAKVEFTQSQYYTILIIIITWLTTYSAYQNTCTLISDMHISI